jgi:hypothetical protein
MAPSLAADAGPRCTSLAGSGIVCMTNMLLAHAQAPPNLHTPTAQRALCGWMGGWVGPLPCTRQHVVLLQVVLLLCRSAARSGRCRTLQNPASAPHCTTSALLGWPHRSNAPCGTPATYLLCAPPFPHLPKQHSICGPARQHSNRGFLGTSRSRRSPCPTWAANQPCPAGGAVMGASRRHSASYFLGSQRVDRVPSRGAGLLLTASLFSLDVHASSSALNTGPSSSTTHPPKQPPNTELHSFTP